MRTGHVLIYIQCSFQARMKESTPDPVQQPLFSWLSKSIVDFPAVTHQAEHLHFLFSIGLVNDPVIAYAKL